MKWLIGIALATIALIAAVVGFGIGFWRDMPFMYGIALSIFLFALAAFVTVWSNRAKQKQTEEERTRFDVKFAEAGCTVLLWYMSYGKPYDLSVPKRGKCFVVDQYEGATVREIILAGLISDEGATYVSDGVRQIAKLNSDDELMEIFDKPNVRRKMTEAELVSLRGKKFVLDKKLYSNLCAARQFRAEYSVFMTENEFIVYEEIGD